MSVVRLKTLFWEIERRKTSLWSSHTARNRSDSLIYATSAINSSMDVSDRLTPFLCVPQRIERVSECPTHILDPRPEASVCRLKHQSAS
ncbi:hypothetical protein TNIN_249361 [Trichonephila inaurata madagascariensis]|uniref:Uncharacterized protein n=1 Tax=Trichonephila inaurata madagascariensis TaxID=2747483 RepID=A0A8X7C1D4_9ARAC|nr:hypothetical protein TNIN_249361 [Trichonephila inaurata madagascariensis]